MKPSDSQDDIPLQPVSSAPTELPHTAGQGALASSGGNGNETACEPSKGTLPADLLLAIVNCTESPEPAAVEPAAVEPAAVEPVIDGPIADKMARCEERLGYTFRNRMLLRAALTHASGAEHRLASNERLEFLGDAVLGLVVCDLLFRNYPSFQEGELTRVKSSVVSRQTCAKLSDLLGLDQFLILGKGMASTGAIPQSLMADVFESLIAAMYLDGGDEVAREFLGRHLAEEIAAAVALAHSDNAKSLLQQIAQRRFGATPSYLLLDEKGPDHSKCFKMAARAGNHEFAPAWGRNKKEAEQRAACNALAELKGELAPFTAD